MEEKRTRQFRIIVTGDSEKDIKPEDINEKLKDLIDVDKINITRDESLIYRDLFSKAGL